MIDKDLDIAKEENETALEYFKKGDYENAFKHWMIAYNNGSVDAIYHLGNMYYYGEYVKEDHIKGNEYFLECANVKDFDNEYVLQATFNIANAYYNGDGFEQDIKEAMNWYLEAANNGHINSMLNVGISYFFGQNTFEADSNLAYDYLLPLAEECDNSVAQCIIGLICYSNADDEDNIMKARYWFTKAAALGNEDAKRYLEQLPEPEDEDLDNLDGLYVSDYDDSEEFDDEDYKDKFKSVVEVEDPSDLEDMTCINMDNIGAFLDKPEVYDESLDEIDFSGKSIFEIEFEACGGNRKAAFLAGIAYINGDGVEVDFEEGFKYLSRSAVYDYPDAVFYLGVCYLEGIGVNKDETLALASFAKAAKLGHEKAIEVINKFRVKMSS